MDKTIIKPYEELHRQVYGYILPDVPSHEGYVKVGDTKREVKVRVFEQVSTAGLAPKILFERTAVRSDGKWFKDTDLHRFFELNGIEKAKFGTATEWFFFNGYLEKAEELTDRYINLDYDEVQLDEDKTDYVLREEQNRAVEMTLDYYYSGQEPKEFLWNAKPRFGKTLTAYDFVRRIKAANVLIVTNRPAIANSWFDDFKKFISWQEPEMKFVSETEALREKAMSRAEFLDYADSIYPVIPSQIAFLSLQDLKGARVFGGNYDKLEWVARLNWDLLIIDEAHEGVDTERTDAAFDNIERQFTLHLSGTPFKALASNKFSEKQIFNWSYLDEQEAKSDWNYIAGSNPYENLPQLSLFTYQMSKMIEDRVSQGLTLDNEANVDYAFDLNEFFSANDRGKFKYETSVRRFLDNLCSGHFPFSEGKHRDELRHTFWLLPRVNSAKALELLLREHPVFKGYTIVLAAGDGVSADHDLEQEATDFKKNEKSYNKVKEAIQTAEANDGRTITLSVGQLTTGVTIPEWSAVLMLNNIKSPSLYFQAAFRAQNPYEFVADGKLYRKENAYIFDFAPERTLTLYDEFANNLSGDGDKTSGKREEGIKELLNFFPVIAEDDQGNMRELDATEVLIIPTKIQSREVVRRGFMSNLLFANISGIFSGHTVFKEILDKIKPEKNKRLLPLREVEVTEPMLDEDGTVYVPREIVINKTDDIFGPGIYSVVTRIDDKGATPREVAEAIEETFADGFTGLKETFGLTSAQLRKVREAVRSDVADALEKTATGYQAEIKTITEDFAGRMEEAREKGEVRRVAELEVQLEKKKEEVNQAFTESLNQEISSTIEAAVEEQVTRVEEEKKKTTEDDVRDHLRGFARTIPAFLMAYGDKETTLADFEKNIDEPTFEELTGITVDEFSKLRDGFEYVDDEGRHRKVPGLFNEVVFNASVKEFFAAKERLSNYFDETLTEDIFDYIPPQKTNQIFTPKRVVKMMVDMLEKVNPGLFKDYNTKFLDPYAKSGLYITEIVKRLYKGLAEQIPEPGNRIRWILENQVYAIAPSNIIHNIVKNYVYPDGLEISTKNLVELDLSAFWDDALWQNRIIDAFGGDEDMKFDVIIGNPPYQIEDEGHGRSAGPVFDAFVEQAMKMNPSYLSMIVPARWYSGGKGLNSFRRMMLSDKRIREIHDFPDYRDVFPLSIQLKGGVCYFLWDRDNVGDCKVTSYHAGRVVSVLDRPLLDFGLDTFIRYNEAISIVRKVQAFSEESIMDLVSPRKPFGLPTNFSGLGRPTKSTLKVYQHGGIGYIDRSEIQQNTDVIDKYKVFIPPLGSGSDGFPHPILGRPFLGEPGSICTETYLFIGPFDNSLVPRNLITYISTRFFRFLVLLNKPTQHATRKVYQLVPKQDFSEPWTDEKLYAKYDITPEEVAFIESMVRPMDLE